MLQLSLFHNFIQQIEYLDTVQVQILQSLRGLQ